MEKYAEASINNTGSRLYDFQVQYYEPLQNGTFAAHFKVTFAGRMY